MRKLWVAGSVAVILVLAGCAPVAPSGSASGGSPGGSSGVAVVSPLVDDAPEGFSEYYGQKVSFGDCPADQVTLPLLPAVKDLENYECATVKAPLNWDDPTSESIELAVGRYSTGSGEGALFYNLGGPGGNAVQSLSMMADMMFPKEIVDSFDLIAVDPRGVGESSPVSCWDDSERDGLFADSEMPDENASLEEQIAFVQNEFKTTATGCLERSGNIVSYVDSDSAARDFDMVRAVLGQKTMDYVGFSYGTLLGAMYAELFPTHVGRFVLDGALDPALNSDQVSAVQAKGMEESLYHWIETCQEGDTCPLAGGLEEGKQQMIDFFDSLVDNPMPTNDPDRPLTESLARTGVVGSLYSVASYEYLEMGLQMAMGPQPDGSVLLFLADYYNGRNDDGTYNNSQDAFTVINALDYEPVGTPQEWQAEADRLAADYPVLGGQFGFGSAGLEVWPFESRSTRHKITAPGTPEILVIGTTHDPATPYSMAESLATSLEKGVLVTWEGWDHTAYNTDGSACVQKIVNSFLLKGDVPDDGVVCSD